MCENPLKNPLDAGFIPYLSYRGYERQRPKCSIRALCTSKILMDKYFLLVSSGNVGETNKKIVLRIKSRNIFYTSFASVSIRVK